MEGSLRTPCIARWPGKIAAGRRSDEIVHITDWFPTLANMAGVTVPDDRVIDGKDQTPFLFGEQEGSCREGFIYWNGEHMYGVKWRNFKLVFVKQTYFTDPALPLGFPHLINLYTDPKEREPVDQLYFHSWTMAHFGRMLADYAASLQREPLIPAGAPLDFVPRPGAKTQDAALTRWEREGQASNAV